MQIKSSKQEVGRVSTINKKRLNIALLGTRGVPANYGGFETCVEEVGRRLVEERAQRNGLLPKE